MGTCLEMKDEKRKGWGDLSSTLQQKLTGLSRGNTSEEAWFTNN